MAAEYEVLKLGIGIDINDKQVKQQAKSLLDLLKELFDGGTFGDGASKAVLSIGRSLKDAYQKAQEIQGKIQELEVPDLSEEEWVKLAQAYELAEQKLEELEQTKRDILSEDEIDTEALQAVEDEIARINEMLVQTGEMLANKAQQDKLIQQLDTVEDKIRIQLKGYQELIAKEKERANAANKTNKNTSSSSRYVKKTANETKKASASAKKLADRTKMIGKNAKSASLSFGKLLKTILSANLLTRVIENVFRKFIEMAKEGFSNLVEESEAAEKSMNTIKAKTLQISNAFAAMVEPIVNKVIPVIAELADVLTVAANKAAQLIAALSGQEMANQAKLIDAETYAIMEETGALQKNNKERNKQLSNLDILNNLHGKQEQDLFDEQTIDPEVLEWVEKLKDLWEKIKDLLKPAIERAKELAKIFAQGFKDGLGDWKSRIEDIKKNLASIKDSLIDIFTDPRVLAAMNKWVDSFVYLLGSIVGSIASIALTIAQNLIGGIAKYLEDNKDRIKEYLIDMFDVWTEINDLLSTFFQDIAYIFEAFGGENGQRMTASIIGIFSSAFMGITQLASRFIRDVINIIVKPIHDNKEGLKKAFDDILGVLADFGELAKQAIDEVVDKAIAIYDEHFKPLFDSIAQGISDLVALLLDKWNSDIKPFLDGLVEKAKTLWNDHLSPFMHELMDLFGSIADLIKVVWEKYLQPLVAWLIEYVLPVVIDVLEAIWTVVADLWGNIYDVLTGIVHAFKGIIDLIIAIINGDWDAAWEACKEIVGGVVDAIMALVQGIVDFIVDVVGGLVDALVSIVKNIGEGIAKTAEKAWEGFKEWLASLIDWLIDFANNLDDKMAEMRAMIFDKLIQKIKDVWTKLKEFAKKVIEGMIKIYNKGVEFKNRAKALIQNLVDFIKEKIGPVLEMIRTVFDELGVPKGNRLTIFNNSRYAGGQRFNGYASGQVIPPSMQEHLAILGDNKQETEVVSPLSTIKQALVEALSESGLGGGSDRPIVVEIDGKQVFSVTKDYANDYKKRTGKYAFG